MQKISVLIVDDHAFVREGLHNLLQAYEDIEVVGEAVDGSEALDKIPSLKPEVVLMDITMPGIDGIEATLRVKKAYPQVKILALTMHDGREQLLNMMSAGASGYFVKGGSAAELIPAIRAVWRGDVFLYPTVTKHLLNGFQSQTETAGHKEFVDKLTRREHKMLKLIAEGLTNQEVAELLHLSPHSVQTHRAHIMATLGLSNHAEVITYARRKRLIDLDV